LPDIVAPNISLPIINKDGTMTDQFQRWTLQVSRLDLIVGTGSPEGVVEALIGQEYMDDTPSASPVKYIKQAADIAGDRTKGWVGI
jgi:hypothetical protein